MPASMRQPALLLTLLVSFPLIAVLAGAIDPKDQTDILRGKAAFGDWRQDRPGLCRLIKAADLPSISKENPNEVEVVKMPAGSKPQVPPGFNVELFASGLSQPRAIRTAPNGDLFVADSKAGEIHVYRIDSDPSHPQSEIFATGLKKPYGIAFYPPGMSPQWVYIATPDAVRRYPYQPGDLKSRGQPEKIIDGLPTTHHWTRDIAFSRDGKRLFLAVGSGSNVALDMFPAPREDGGLSEWVKNKPLGAAWDTEERRANILTFDPDGKNEKIFATGIRNPAGITIQPETGQLWAAVNERDGLGDDGPFEYATHVEEGAFYGWPWYYIGSHADSRVMSSRPDLKDHITVPDVLIQAHSAALQIVFYDSDAFGEGYKGDAFVTLHGSWDRAKRTGYKVIRLHFDNGKATGEYEDFMTGFVLSDKQVWGRPVGVTVGKDGALYVTEDGSGTIWRVTRGDVRTGR
jgi:glucose/arabinose dehydrogenase